MANSLGKARDNQASEQLNVSNPNNQQSTTELPAKGDQFDITIPDEPNLEDDESLGNWLNLAHQASEKADMAIGKVLQQKKELLKSQGKATNSGWVKWVEDNCNFSVRTANRYIKTYEAGSKELPSSGNNDDKPIRGNVTFTDKELGNFYREAKQAKEIKQKFNEKFEQAARDVRDELQKEAEANGLELDEHLHNKLNEENLKNVNSGSSQN
jgi:hypothetical protein